VTCLHAVVNGSIFQFADNVPIIKLFNDFVQLQQNGLINGLAVKI